VKLYLKIYSIKALVSDVEVREGVVIAEAAEDIGFIRNIRAYQH